MLIEKPKLIIPRSTEERVFSQTRTPSELRKFCIRQLPDVGVYCPNLIKYFVITAPLQRDNLTGQNYHDDYRYGFGLSFGLMKEHFQQEGIVLSLTTEEIKKLSQQSRRTFHDVHWLQSGWIDKIILDDFNMRGHSGFGKFLNTAQECSPGLFEYMNNFCRQIKTPSHRRFPYRGFFDGFMPFYRRICECD